MIVHCVKWPPQTPDLYPTEHFWEMVELEFCLNDATGRATEKSPATVSCYHINTDQKECLQQLLESIM